MKSFAILCASAIGLFSVPAHACDAELEVVQPRVDIRPSPAFLRSQSREQIQVRVENTGEQNCTLALGLSLDPAFAGPFPQYSITGPGGIIEAEAQSISAARRAGELRAPLVLSPGAETTVDYNVATSVGWNLQAGSYERRLRLRLFDAANASLLDEEEVELGITVPLSSQIDFVGNVDRIALGRLTIGRDNVSPPFGIRVYSTSTYNMQFESENAGQLRQEDGSGLLPYRMLLSGNELNLRSGSHLVSGLNKSADLGDVFGVVVRVKPDATTPAGLYSDRVRVTVTPY